MHGNFRSLPRVFRHFNDRGVHFFHGGSGFRHAGGLLVGTAFGLFNLRGKLGGGRRHHIGDFFQLVGRRQHGLCFSLSLRAGCVGLLHGFLCLGGLFLRMLRLLFCSFYMFTQSIHHMHNGTVHAHARAAVVNGVIPLHHTLGHSIQFAGVLAQLLQDITDNHPRQQRTKCQGYQHQGNDPYFGRGIHDIPSQTGIITPLSVISSKRSQCLRKFIIRSLGRATQHGNSFFRIIFLGKY